MTALMAARCERCGKVEPYDSSKPDAWWVLYAPRGHQPGRLDFCSVACLTLHFAPAGTSSREVVANG